MKMYYIFKEIWVRLIIKNICIMFLFFEIITILLKLRYYIKLEDWLIKKSIVKNSKYIGCGTEKMNWWIPFQITKT